VPAILSPMPAMKLKLTMPENGMPGSSFLSSNISLKQYGVVLG